MLTIHALNFPAESAEILRCGWRSRHHSALQTLITKSKELDRTVTAGIVGFSDSHGCFSYKSRQVEILYTVDGEIK